MRLDVNSMKPLDNLCHPVSVIADAEQLAAEAFGAAHAFLMVGGTTSAVQSMVLTAVKGARRLYCREMSTAASWARWCLRRGSGLCEPLAIRDWGFLNACGRCAPGDQGKIQMLRRCL